LSQEITSVARGSRSGKLDPKAVSPARPAAQARERDVVVDGMRGVAILMVIGIHSLSAAGQSAAATVIDAVLRPCVPIFLFVSGYLTARAGQVPLGKRLHVVLVPYAIAFLAAYVYMALHNPAMDHRPLTLAARFGLAYVFVYYYVFIYVGCTVGLWLVFRLFEGDRLRLVAVLAAAILLGLVVGAYLDPALARLDISESLIQEVRLRDVPFWFGFAALGALVVLLDARPLLPGLRQPLLFAVVAAYATYALVRVLNIGDAGDYDSTAFFAYAALLCLALFAFAPRVPALVAIGSGSYFIYLWHIFVIMALVDHTSLREWGPVVGSLGLFLSALVVSVGCLTLVRHTGSRTLVRWLGA
jgi:surface polysaccharide O-acyltransferase-like enzyme